LLKSVILPFTRGGSRGGAIAPPQGKGKRGEKRKGEGKSGKKRRKNGKRKEEKREKRGKKGEDREKKGKEIEKNMYLSRLRLVNNMFYFTR